MELKPGFYCATRSKVYPVNYTDVPDVKIFDAWGFFNTLEKIKPGHRIYGEFNLADAAAWDRIPDHLKKSC